eukprot:6202352-Pleurochrysis_carterae.AAC.1
MLFQRSSQCYFPLVCSRTRRTRHTAAATKRLLGCNDRSSSPTLRTTSSTAAQQAARAVDGLRKTAGRGHS